MKKITFYFTVALLLIGAAASAQGVTTAGINGRIIDANSEPLLGANVVAVHANTGAIYGAITDFEGFYRISNMRSGRPYTVTISYVGYEDNVKTGVFL